MMKRIYYILIFTLFPLLTFAQDKGANDFFGNIGKIYVVVGVLMILFVTMIGFLIYLERKLTRIEKLFDE
jgi:hypothetical protein